MTEVVFKYMPDDVKSVIFKDLDLVDVLSWSITSKTIMNFMNQSHWWMKLLTEEVKLSKENIIRIDTTFVRQHKGWVYVMGSFYDCTRKLDPFANYYFCPFCSSDLSIKRGFKSKYLNLETDAEMDCSHCNIVLKCRFAKVCVSCQFGPGTISCECGRVICEDCTHTIPCSFCTVRCHICSNPIKPPGARSCSHCNCLVTRV